MEEQDQGDQTERSPIDLNCAKINLPLLMSKHRLEVEKLQVPADQAEEQLKKLVADRDAMIVKAPIDGIVYYGSAVRGKWSAASVETLRRGDSILPNEVFMTVVQTRPADDPRHACRKASPAGPRGPAGRRSSPAGFAGLQALGRRRSASAPFPWEAAGSTAN